MVLAHSDMGEKLLTEKERKKERKKRKGECVSLRVSLYELPYLSHWKVPSCFHKHFCSYDISSIASLGVLGYSKNPSCIKYRTVLYLRYVRYIS